MSCGHHIPLLGKPPGRPQSKPFLEEGITHLHGGVDRRESGAELGRGQSCPAHWPSRAVVLPHRPPGFADPAGPEADDSPRFSIKPQAIGVHQRGCRCSWDRRATSPAQRWDANAIAVVGRFAGPPTPRIRPTFAGVVERGQKRRAFEQGIGSGPMVKMSRRMPPTPVAAPWNGSPPRVDMASILKEAAGPRPDPTPHRRSSPAPQAPGARWWENRLSRGLELRSAAVLDHIHPNMPSQPGFGSRPRRRTISS